MTKYYVTEGSLKLRHVGILELGEFYTWLQRWFDFEMSWKDSNEKYYEEVILPGGDAKNIEMQWKVEKQETNYFKYVITLDFTFIAVSDTEIQVDGKRKKAQKGDYEIRINSYLETKTDDLNTFFITILEKILFRNRIEMQRILLFEKVQSLHENIKNIFKQYEVS